MNSLLFAACLIVMSPLFSSAQDFATPRIDPVPETLQLTGRGIQNEDSEEVIFLACVDPQSGCHRLRIVQLKPQKTPVWLGNEFPSENTIQVREDLKKWYKERRVDDLFSFLSNANYTYAFTEKNGWAWSNSPIKLQKKDFNRITSSLIYYATYHHAAESEQSLVEEPKTPPPVPAAMTSPSNANEGGSTTPDQIQIIKNPKINGYPFSSNANPDGVCQVVGFRRSIPGSVKTSGTAAGSAVIVGEDGKVLGGEIVTSQSGHWISELICTQPVTSKTAIDQVQRVYLPKKNSVLFSSQTNIDGLCRVLGFERSAPGTTVTDGSSVGPTLITDRNGHLIGGEIVTKQAGHWVKELLCVNPISFASTEETVSLVKNPSSRGMPFSSQSSSDGVCKTLGYRQSLPETTSFEGSKIGATLIVDASGAVTGSETVDAKAGHWIKALLCVK